MTEDAVRAEPRTIDELEAGTRVSPTDQVAERPGLADDTAGVWDETRRQNQLAGGA